MPQQSAPEGDELSLINVLKTQQSACEVQLQGSAADQRAVSFTSQSGNSSSIPSPRTEERKATYRFNQQKKIWKEAEHITDCSCFLGQGRHLVHEVLPQNCSLGCSQGPPGTCNHSLFQHFAIILKKKIKRKKCRISESL